MKTKEELNAIKEEVKTLNKKLAELSEEELAEVAGGMIPPLIISATQCTLRPGMQYGAGNNDWGSSQKLPTEIGSYKLGTDIGMGGEWIPDPQKTTIDK